MVVHKFVALIFISKRELCALLCEATSIICINYLLGSIFFISFCKFVTCGCRKSVSFWLPVRENSGNFDSRIGYEPCKCKIHRSYGTFCLYTVLMALT